MKRYVPSIACVLLAAALVFLGLSHRYTVTISPMIAVGSHRGCVAIKLDRLTGATQTSILGDFNIPEYCQAMPWSLLEDYQPSKPFTPPPLSSEETDAFGGVRVSTNTIPAPPPGFELQK